MRRKFRIKKPFYKKSWFWFSLFFVFLISLSLYFLFFSQFFLIKKIEILDKNFPEKDELKDFVLKLSKENFLKRENIFLFDSKMAKKKILEKFLKIENVKIVKKFPQKIEILIKEREPAFFIQNYLIDKNGILFEEGKKENLLEIEKENFKASLGKEIFSRDFAKKILKIKKECEKLGIPVKKAKIEEEKIEFLTKEGWKIFFDFEKDVDFQLKKLKTILEKGIEKEKRNNLEYIDLRFGNLASVKYKNP